MFEKALDLALRQPTPFFLFDLSKTERSFLHLKQAFGTSEVYYAVKANSHPVVLLTLKNAGAKFEVSSPQEISTLSQLQVPAEKIIYSHPVKAPHHISCAFSEGISTFTFDSPTELEKLAKMAPKSKVFLRLSVENEGSLFPLSGKFGASPQEANKLLLDAKKRGLEPIGLSFHVGSQNERLATWEKAMLQASEAWNSSSVRLTHLNIGGGFPAPYCPKTLSLERISATVLSSLERFSSKPVLMLEPGRFVTATSGALVASVLGTATRDGGKHWLYLDVGALHGLFESLQAGRSFPYTVLTERSEGTQDYVLSGQTCDPDDTIFESIQLPKMEVGDKVVFLNAGAYSWVYATSFNGFSPPKMHFTLDERKEHGKEGAEREQIQAH